MLFRSFSLEPFFGEVVRCRQLRHDNVLTMIGLGHPESGYLPSVIYPMLGDGDLRRVLDSDTLPIGVINEKQLEIWVRP